jgi:hypothetical protein
MLIAYSFCTGYMLSYDTVDIRRCTAAAGGYTPHIDGYQQCTAIARDHNHGVLATPQLRCSLGRFVQDDLPPKLAAGDVPLAVPYP